MIIPVAALCVLLLPILLGGKPARLAAVKLRHISIIAAALGIQILIVELITGPAALLQGAHIATYLAALWFMIANRRIPGLWLIGLGATSNGLTITLNGGTLPARPGALHAAGIDSHPDRFVNSGALNHPHLPWLGDIFAVPTPLPLANVFSIGDILIITGLAIAAWRILGTRWTTPWNPRHPALLGNDALHATRGFWEQTSDETAPIGVCRVRPGTTSHRMRGRRRRPGPPGADSGHRSGLSGLRG